MVDLSPIHTWVKSQNIDEITEVTLYHFIESYCKAALHGGAEEDTLYKTCKRLSEFVVKEAKKPSTFDYFHKRVTEPFNYSKFSLDFMRPLIDWDGSKISGEAHLKEMEEALKRGENVILFANHQVEPDPQVLYLALEKKFPLLSEKMIFVAGDRVVRDPVAIPLSLGCNLLCIYSKKYVDSPPEEKEQKLLHNKKTMGAMEELLKEGGQIIYVAPSGGRDRLDSDGVLLPALFDSTSIEMFYLIAKRAKTTTHFHTLALYTYPLLPPPSGVNIQLGEKRITSYSPFSLTFGPAFDMENDTLHSFTDKKEKRKKRTEMIYEKVLADYKCLLD